MEKSIKIRKLLIFAGTGAVAYLVMHLLGQGGKAWETVRGNVVFAEKVSFTLRSMLRAACAISIRTGMCDLLFADC